MSRANNFGAIDERRRRLVGYGALTLAASLSGCAGARQLGPSHASVGKTLTSQQRQAIETAFFDMIERGEHPGAQLAVYQHGQLILDLAGGATRTGGEPVRADTLFQIRSTTKALTTLVMMQALERKQVDLDAVVADYWPEFARNGKAGITVGQILSHRAGIPDGPAIPAQALGDPAAVAEAVANMTPVWDPGTANGYHAATIGWVCDEVLRRVTGQPMEELFRQDVLQPLGVSDLHIGLPREHFERMAPMTVHPDIRERSPLRARFSDFLNTPEGIALPLSWVSGVGTARALAQVLNVLAYEGQYAGRPYFRPQTQALMSAPTNAADEVDKRLLYPMRWGYGFILGSTPGLYASQPGPRVIGHAGGGACVGWVDPDERLAVAFLTNHMVRGKESRASNRAVGDPLYEGLRA